MDALREAYEKDVASLGAELIKAVEKPLKGGESGHASSVAE